MSLDFRSKDGRIQAGIENPKYFKSRLCDYCGEKPRKKKFRINFLNGEGAKMFCSQKCKDAHFALYK